MAGRPDFIDTHLRKPLSKLNKVEMGQKVDRDDCMLLMSSLLLLLTSFGSFASLTNEPFHVPVVTALPVQQICSYHLHTYNPHQHR